MSLGRDPIRLLVLAQILAFWPVWRWYAQRLLEPGEAGWRLLALLTVALASAGGGARSSPPGPLWVPTAAMLVYAALFPFVPPLVRALLAFVCLGLTWSRWRRGRWWDPALVGLFVLSAPLVPSLEFFLGFPLRLLAGSIASVLLRLVGFAVVREGTCLNWGGQLVLIDAPCSGVRMLWGVLYLTSTLACLCRLDPLRCLAALMAAVGAVVVGNAVRSAALFFTEAGVVAFPEWTHVAIGLSVFSLMVGSLVALVRRLEAQCVTRCSA